MESTEKLPYAEMRGALLKMSDQQVDPEAKKLIRAWGDPPTSLQVLEAVEKSAYYSWTSDFEIRVMWIIYDSLLRDEGRTDADNTPLATWRT